MKKKGIIKLICLTAAAALVVSAAAYAAYTPAPQAQPLSEHVSDEVLPLSEHVSDEVFLAMLERVQRFDPNVFWLYTVLGDDGIVYYHPIFSEDDNFIPNATPTEEPWDRLKYLAEREAEREEEKRLRREREERAIMSLTLSLDEPWQVLVLDLFYFDGSENHGSLRHGYIDGLREKGIPIDDIVEILIIQKEIASAEREEEKRLRDEIYTQIFMTLLSASDELKSIGFWDFFDEYGFLNHEFIDGFREKGIPIDDMLEMLNLHEAHSDYGDHVFCPWTDLGSPSHHGRICMRHGCGHTESAWHNHDIHEKVSWSDSFFFIRCSECNRLMGALHAGF